MSRGERGREGERERGREGERERGREGERERGREGERERGREGERERGREGERERGREGERERGRIHILCNSALLSPLPLSLDSPGWVPLPQRYSPLMGVAYPGLSGIGLNMYSWSNDMEPWNILWRDREGVKLHCEG